MNCVNEDAQVLEVVIRVHPVPQIRDIALCTKVLQHLLGTLANVVLKCTFSGTLISDRSLL